MAPELKGKKRKGATEQEPASKKLKKATAAATSKPSKKETQKPAPASKETTSKSTSKGTRKRAADFFDAGENPADDPKPAEPKTFDEVPVAAGDEAETSKKEKKTANKEKAVKPKEKAKETKEPKAKKQKTAAPFEDKSPAAKAIKAVSKEVQKAEKTAESKTKTAAKDAKGATKSAKEKVVKEAEKKSKKGKISQAAESDEEQKPENVEAGDDNAEEPGESDVEDEDDQTEALLKGFESSDEEDRSGDEGFERGQDVPALDKKTQKKLKAASKKKEEDEETPGVVYVGRIPHGFYEHEMRAYFSQFGTISRLRLSRNRKTGRSKHYAFIEFASAPVARIVADTMNNYLMFGHILKCRVVPKEQVHEQLWKGANKRFKAVPWNKLEGRRLKQPKTKQEWAKKVTKERGKRETLKEKLKAFGYDFEVPDVKGVEEVETVEKLEPIKESEAPKVIEDKPADEEVERTIVEEKTQPNGIVVDEQVKTKKGKEKAAEKVKPAETETAPVEEEKKEPAQKAEKAKPKEKAEKADTAAKKGKKSKKAAA